jgi:ELWxxDGT repeat protein
MKITISLLFTVLSFLCQAQSEFTRVKDIFPSGSSDPSGFAIVNGKLLCVADDGIHGRELFEIDSLGTDCTLFKDINLNGSSFPSGFIYFDDKYWFVAYNELNGNELWTTDGSPSDTKRFSDTLIPGEISTAEPVLVENKLFYARQSYEGSELWITNGSQGGTYKVKNLGPAMLDNPYGLTPLDGKIYFNAYDNYWGVWVSDGTEAGTRLVKRTCPIYHNGCLKTNIQVCGSKVYFQVYDFDTGEELWALDTETDSVFLVKDINLTGSSAPYNLTTFHDRLYFLADDGINDCELWTTDGTPEGTFMVKDINPAGLSYPNTFTIYNGRMYFSAQDGVHGYELWSSDGTENGTFMVKDCNPNGNFIISSFITFNDHLYFCGEDDLGKVMWVTDGTSEGTHKVEPPFQYNTSPLLTFPHWIVYNDALYMGAEYDSTGKELWKLTGSSASIQDYHLSDFSVYPNPAHNTIRLRGITNKFELSVYDVTGKLIIWQKADGFENDIDIHKIDPGFYFITVSQNGKLKQLKFIKQ